LRKKIKIKGRVLERERKIRKKENKWYVLLRKYINNLKDELHIYIRFKNNLYLRNAYIILM